MSTIRYELVNATVQRAYSLIDYNIHTDMHKQYEFRKQFILDDKLLTDDEKTDAINYITKTYDRNKVRSNSGTKRICENCNQKCLATLYCEYCVCNYLKANFKNWTSGNNDVDNLIQKCQSETLMPSKVIEWIPFNNLKNIKYLTKGGFSEIYTATWIDGSYDKWNPSEQQLIRFRNGKVILKKLENVECANQSWFEEAKSHLTLCNKWAEIVRCFGLTRDISNGNYMLVMRKMDMDLRKYLQQNYIQLTWKEKIRIAFDIIGALYFIHKEKAIHRDLHSGNILFSQFNDTWRISDLGFCGPADKSSKSIYGNLPYIAPEVIIGREYTFASDIYSIAILMWEISSGQPPFINYEHDYDLAINIINGIRPKIVPGTPLEYKNLMVQCWDADPLKRLDLYTFWRRMQRFNIDSQNMSDEFFQSKIDNLEMNKVEENYTSSRLFTSKIHQFVENLPEPRNATEEEQEAFHSKSYDFSIPDNINDFSGSNKQNSNKSLKVINIFKDDGEKLPEEFRKLQIYSNDDEKEIVQKQTKMQNINIDDDGDDTHNNPNLHSNEQDELEIPDDGF